MLARFTMPARTPPARTASGAAYRAYSGPPPRAPAPLQAQMIKLGDVIVEDLVLLLFAQVGRMLLEQFLRPGPRRIAMREIVGPHQAAEVAHVLHLEGHPVVLEGQVDIFAEILTGQLRDRPRGEPVAMAVVVVVHLADVVRRPPGVRLDTHHLEPGMALEDAAQDEHPDDVLVATDDRKEAVELGAARASDAVLAAGQDMEAERKPEIDRCLPERVVDCAVIVLELRIARHHHALEAEVLDMAKVLDTLLDRAHRGLSHADQAVGMG